MEATPMVLTVNPETKTHSQYFCVTERLGENSVLYRHKTWGEYPRGGASDN